MRTLIRPLAALPAALALVFSASAAHAVTTLKVSHYLGSNHNFHTQVLEPWCAEMEKESAGQLKCQIYPALQLGGTPPQLPDQVKNGVADIAWISPSFSTGRFPRSEALELPFTLPRSSRGGSLAMWEYTQKHAMDDFKDFKVLSIWSGSSVVISTANKPVIAPEDIKGLKLRSPSRYPSMFLQALGGVPVNMPPAQITEAISKGVIDGAMAPWEVLPAVKVDEVTKYHIEGPAKQPGFTQTPFALLMNKQKYESLPPQLKAVVDKHSGLPLIERTAKVWDDGNDAARKKMTAQGNKVLVIKDADYATLKKTTASVEAEWIKQVTAKGIDGAKLAAAAHAIGAKYQDK